MQKVEKNTTKLMTVWCVKGVCCQSTFICEACGVALCSPELVERTQAPRDCFRVYHKNFDTCDFSVASDADVDSMIISTKILKSL